MPRSSPRSKTPCAPRCFAMAPGTPTIAACALPRGASKPGGSLQLAVEEVGGGVISAQPVFMAQEVMNVVGKDQLLELDVALAQAAHQLDRLIESDIAVIVAVNQQHRRFPFFDRRQRR